MSKWIVAELVRVLHNHKARLVEYDQSSGTVTISPRGIELVETEILPQLAR